MIVGYIAHFADLAEEFHKLRFGSPYRQIMSKNRTRIPIYKKRVAVTPVDTVPCTIPFCIILFICKIELERKRGGWEGGRTFFRFGLFALALSLKKKYQQTILAGRHTVLALFLSLVPWPFLAPVALYPYLCGGSFSWESVTVFVSVWALVVQDSTL